MIAIYEFSKFAEDGMAKERGTLPENFSFNDDRWRSANMPNGNELDYIDSYLWKMSDFLANVILQSPVFAIWVYRRYKLRLILENYLS